MKVRPYAAGTFVLLKKMAAIILAAISLFNLVHFYFLMILSSVSCASGW